uniref:NAD(P)H-quinone oxidoreductase subunit 6, chloroplastic n=1 Tax=Chaetosphaeridium globosum TaxID=96477 RepID=NU6C_CHAGL|nr:NADH dehydrogenase subunit 6 [Chaetosphaeridium globosum]Q8M9T8.1 RecName: Full=NAD(P)H-quinone oxidoreductase subunit 6, chloroplastic; AltName: Full=NAD(P)H dehydrogenase subunit 6; AltName: Full=NADH-plastoquinone oxidoreductase subunit 6 [Chaetosphaeridium globosum]AAM96520.1 subunit 6 of NADH-plastoquinone oxidoreductase [Chaetosphaeridium globosum]
MLEQSAQITLFVLDFFIFVGALGVVFFNNIIYSALFLGLTFLSVALLYLLLGSEFLSVAQVIIYVGAINVLIVFAIMLVNKPEFDKKDMIWVPIDLKSFCVNFILFSTIVTMIVTTPWKLLVNNIDVKLNSLNFLSPIAKIGYQFLSTLVLPFELLSLLLLIALIGAVIIARRELIEDT